MDGRNAQILLKNSDFRLDHNCRDRAAVTRNFARDSAYNSGRDPAIFVACARAHSSSKERKRETKPFFPREANSGVFQQNPQIADIPPSRGEQLGSTYANEIEPGQEENVDRIVGL
jgi:hypothetical protein